MLNIASKIKHLIYIANSCIVLRVVHAVNLWKLFGNISSNEHGLQVDPEILNNQPVLDYFRCRR